jgi:hypothetical protein
VRTRPAVVDSTTERQPLRGDLTGETHNA